MTEFSQEHLSQTIAAAKAAYQQGQAERPLRRGEFLLWQSRYVKKRWWVIQAGLLALLWLILEWQQSDMALRRLLGTAGPLFAMLLLPELWKNRDCRATEVEGTTLYTLRQVYSARMVLFAGVDAMLLTVFFAGLSLSGRTTVWQLMTQFLLPGNVACGICFCCLYSRRGYSESVCLVLCAVWTAVWGLLVCREEIYCAITPAVWAAALTGSVLFLGAAIGAGQRRIIQKGIPLWN